MSQSRLRGKGTQCPQPFTALKTSDTVHPIRPIDPVITFRNSQNESVRGTLTNVQRRSLVMEIYNPYSIVQISEVLRDLTIRSGERSIYKGTAVVTSLLNTGLMAVVSVVLIDEWSDLMRRAVIFRAWRKKRSDLSMIGKSVFASFAATRSSSVRCGLFWRRRLAGQTRRTCPTLCPEVLTGVSGTMCFMRWRCR